MTCRLELGRDDVLHLVGGNGKGNQCRGNIEILKAAGHAVLAADGADAEVHLRLERTKQCRKRLSPALAVRAGLLKILLEGQIHILKGRAGRDQLGNGFHDRQIRAVIGAFLGDEGVVAPRHQGDGVGVLLLNTDLLHHRLDRGELMLTAEGHQHRTRADGGVKALRQSALRADIQISGERVHILGERPADRFVIVLRSGRGDIDMLLRAVRVEEFAGNIDDLVAVPCHGEARFFFDHRYRAGVQVLLFRECQKRLNIFGLNNDCHALLRFGDRQLRAVQTLIFLGNGVEVDIKTVSELADGNGNTARAEVITALDHAGRFPIAE